MPILYSTPSPSERLTARPIYIPTAEPTNQPTSSPTIGFQNEFSNAISSNTIVNMGKDLVLSSTILIHFVFDLIIHGNGHVIDGNGVCQGFSIIGGSVTISNLTIANCFSAENGGAMSIISAEASLENCFIVFNTGNLRGGIYLESSTAILLHCKVQNNTSRGTAPINSLLADASGGGGFLLVDSGSIELSDCDISKNAAPLILSSCASSCTAGYHMVEGYCIECPAGQYQPLSTALICIACFPGSFSKPKAASCSSFSLGNISQTQDAIPDTTQRLEEHDLHLLVRAARRDHMRRLRECRCVHCVR
jgi:hypothetical protein